MQPVSAAYLLIILTYYRVNSGAKQAERIQQTTLDRRTQIRIEGCVNTLSIRS